PAADNGVIAGEAPLPVRMTDDHERRGPGAAILLRGKGAPAYGVHAEKREVVAADEPAASGFGRVGGGRDTDGQLAGAAGGEHIREHLVLVADLLVQRAGEEVVAHTARGQGADPRGIANGDQPGGFADGKSAEKKGV